MTDGLLHAGRYARLLLKEALRHSLLRLPIFRPLKTFPIESTQAIIPVCTAVLRSIMDAVYFDHINVVGCYRRGAGWYAVEDRPTVVVLVAIGLKCGYIPIEKSGS